MEQGRREERGTVVRTRRGPCVLHAFMDIEDPEEMYRESDPAQVRRTPEVFSGSPAVDVRAPGVKGDLPVAGRTPSASTNGDSPEGESTPKNLETSSGSGQMEGA